MRTLAFQKTEHVDFAYLLKLAKEFGDGFGKPVLCLHAFGSRDHGGCGRAVLSLILPCQIRLDLT